MKRSNESQYIAQVRALLSRITGLEHPASSIFGQAQYYFSEKATKHQQLLDLKNKVAECKKNQSTATDNKQNKRATHQLNAAEQVLATFQQKIADEKLSRQRFLDVICSEILLLTEGVTLDETNRKSARLLGTIQLLIDTDASNVAILNERAKPLYKAVLCLRLLDQLIVDNQLNSNYVSARLTEVAPEQYHEFSSHHPIEYDIFEREVKVPLIMSALLQDIGILHPQAQLILKGFDGQANPFRMLENAERKKLLKINYEETIHFAVSGVGVGKYIGNSKEERLKFEKTEKEKLQFINHLLKSWLNPQQGVGNILKVPQIYTSIVLSTKENFDFKLVPQVFQVLKQNVEKGFCNGAVVDCMKKVTGMFPQGFGITYIPKDSAGHNYDRFEYAIVNGLFPSKFRVPHCRVVTRNLTFTGRGIDLPIAPENNLYFPETAKVMTRMSKQRLNEILELLASNYHERQNLDVLPRYWNPKDYFSDPKHQNLWNKI